MYISQVKPAGFLSLVGVAYVRALYSLEITLVIFSLILVLVDKIIFLIIII